LYAYTIRITNTGTQAAQLLTRHWIISDANGGIEEVRGPGVVGATPHLEPGQAFEYSSFCPLPTPSGVMRGTFQMVRPSGEQFDAEVAEFRLDEDLEYN
jgi:ApaG protein